MLTSLIHHMRHLVNKYVSKFWLCAVFAFLYAPLLFLVVFSFNSTRQDAVFTGFSTRWYEALASDPRLVDGFFLSLKVALISATLATILATLAAYALVRLGKFRGRTFFSGMVNAPLVMPEVIIGMSLLLLLAGAKHTIGWPDRGIRGHGRARGIETAGNRGSITGHGVGHGAC